MAEKKKPAGATVAARQEPLDGRVSGAAGVALAPATPAFRTSLRVQADDVAAISKALGLELPTKPKTSAAAPSGRRALWLGPDEWLILDEEADPMKDLSRAKTLHSAVDISHRNIAIGITGKGARATLEAGCPQDLSDEAFPVGACTRTVLGKIEVVILRTGEEAFRVECWRSFSDYAFTLLSEAAGDCLA